MFLSLFLGKVTSDIAKIPYRLIFMKILPGREDTISMKPVAFI